MIVLAIYSHNRSSFQTRASHTDGGDRETRSLLSLSSIQGLASDPTRKPLPPLLSFSQLCSTDKSVEFTPSNFSTSAYCRIEASVLSEWTIADRAACKTDDTCAPSLAIRLLSPAPRVRPLLGLLNLQNGTSVASHVRCLDLKW
jgi:hypothetical protein